MHVLACMHMCTNTIDRSVNQQKTIAKNLSQIYPHQLNLMTDTFSHSNREAADKLQRGLHSGNLSITTTIVVVVVVIVTIIIII